MSFTGDLQHLPIVDVIQLLHSTRKSGTLCVMGGKGESRIVFNVGRIHSANHGDEAFRIGKILVEMGAVTAEARDRALAEQAEAGADRKPLLQTLIESGELKKEEAMKGLQTLIEMTVVEMLRWTRGTFALDVDAVALSDEFRYFPEKMNQEVSLDTQMVLMDALRIYDEKMRDGEFAEDEDLPAEEEGGGSLSAEVLGLADLDNIERKIPEVLSGLETFDPSEIHRQKIAETMPGLSPEEQEELVAFLTEGAAEISPKEGGQARALVLFGRDELLRYSVTTLCKLEGLLVFATDEEQDLDHIIEQFLSKGMTPVLVLDSPEGEGGEERVSALRRRKKERYPLLPIVQLDSSSDPAFSSRAFRDGARAVLPRPAIGEGTEACAGELKNFLKNFLSYTAGCFEGQGGRLPAGLVDKLYSLRDLREAPEIALALLRFVSEIFERSVTFIVRPRELVAERGVGVGAEKSEGAGPPLKFKIPLVVPSVLSSVIEGGRLYYGEVDDATSRKGLFEKIGAPFDPRILLLPMRSRGKTVAVTYADFGPKEARPVPTDLLEILAGQAGLVLENSLLRRQLEKSNRQG